MNLEESIKEQKNLNKRIDSTEVWRIWRLDKNKTWIKTSFVGPKKTIKKIERSLFRTNYMKVEAREEI